MACRYVFYKRGKQKIFTDACMELQVPPCKNLGLFVHPRNCSRYYRCDNNGVLECPCGQDTFFNSESQNCDHKRNVDCGCDGNGLLPSPDQERDIEPKRNLGPVIAGVVVGFLVLVILAVLIICVYRRRKAKDSSKSLSTPEKTIPTTTTDVNHYQIDYSDTEEYAIITDSKIPNESPTKKPPSVNPRYQPEAPSAPPTESTYHNAVNDNSNHHDSVVVWEESEIYDASEDASVDDKGFKASDTNNSIGNDNITYSEVSKKENDKVVYDNNTDTKITNDVQYHNATSKGIDDEAKADDLKDDNVKSESGFEYDLAQEPGAKAVPDMDGPNVYIDVIG